MGAPLAVAAVAIRADVLIEGLALGDGGGVSRRGYGLGYPERDAGQDTARHEYDTQTHDDNAGRGPPLHRL